MSPNATSVVDAVCRSIASGDGIETAYSLVLTARTIVDADGDPVARTFLARKLLMIAVELDGDVLLCPTLQ